MFFCLFCFFFTALKCTNCNKKVSLPPPLFPPFLALGLLLKYEHAIDGGELLIVTAVYSHTLKFNKNKAHYGHLHIHFTQGFFFFFFFT